MIRQTSIGIKYCVDASKVTEKINDMSKEEVKFWNNIMNKQDNIDEYFILEEAARIIDGEKVIVIKAQFKEGIYEKMKS